MALSTEFTVAVPFVVAAYLDLRRLTQLSLKRVSVLEHCHIKCRPEDSKILEGNKP